MNFQIPIDITWKAVSNKAKIQSFISRVVHIEKSVGGKVQIKHAARVGKIVGGLFERGHGFSLSTERDRDSVFFKIIYLFGEK